MQLSSHTFPAPWCQSATQCVTRSEKNDFLNKDLIYLNAVTFTLDQRMRYDLSLHFFVLYNFVLFSIRLWRTAGHLLWQFVNVCEKKLK